MTDRVPTDRLLRGAVSGIFGAVGFGLLLQFWTRLPVLEMVVPALYGFKGPALLVGWILHLFHGSLLGAIFVQSASEVGFLDLYSKIEHRVLLSVCYGLFIWIVLAVVLVPLWLQYIGFGGAPPFPNFVMLGPFGHTVYGVLLLIFFWFLE